MHRSLFININLPALEIFFPKFGSHFSDAFLYLEVRGTNTSSQIRDLSSRERSICTVHLYDGELFAGARSPSLFIKVQPRRVDFDARIGIPLRQMEFTGHGQLNSLDDHRRFGPTELGPA